MPSSRTTLSTMSKALNLSISTVSKALSGSHEIGDKTKKRVLEYAKQSNYVPNSLASSFRRGTTNTIGLILPNVLNPFYAKVLVGVEAYLSEKGYKLITAISNDFIEKETKNLSVMSSGFVDGLILCVSREAVQKKDFEHIKTLIDNGTPIVTFDRICKEIDCDKVITDDYKAAFDATQYLITQRHCKHIVITSKTKTLSHLTLRKKGFIKAANMYKSKVKYTLITDERSIGLKDKLSNLLKEDPSVDGIFCLNEKSVLHAILVTNKLKKEDCNISIAGFCNDMQSKYDATLTVINQNAREMGRASAKLLLDRIKSKESRYSFSTKTIDVSLNTKNLH